MRTIVVVGGTKIQWNESTFLSKKANGRFGMYIANAFANAGSEVLLIHSDETDLSIVSEKVTELRSFKTFDDLHEILFNLRKEKFKVIVMGASLNQYAFVKKRTSVAKRVDINVKMTKTPAIVSLMHSWYESFQPRIVSFMFEEDANPNRKMEALSVATENKLDMVVVNNQRDSLGLPGNYPVYFVTSDGNLVKNNKTNDVAAEALVRMLEVRASATYFGTKEVEYESTISDNICRKKAFEVFDFGMEWGLIHAGEGTASLKINEKSHWISPSAEDLDSIEKEDFIYVKEKLDEDAVIYSGGSAPDKKTFSYAALYKRYPEIYSAISFTEGFVIPDVAIDSMYPSGTKESVNSILEAIGDSFDSEYGMILSQASQGNLILLTREGTKLLERDAGLAFVNMTDMWASIGENHRAMEASLSPIFAKGRVVGIVAKVKDWHSIFINKEHRGNGYGKAATIMLATDNLKIAVHEDSESVSFYNGLGYNEVARDGSLLVMSS